MVDEVSPISIERTLVNALSSLGLLLGAAAITVLIRQTIAHLWIVNADPAGLCTAHRLIQQRLIPFAGLATAMPSLVLTSAAWTLAGPVLWLLHRQAPWWITTRCCLDPRARAAVRADVPDHLECRCGRRAVGASALQGSLVYEPLCRPHLLEHTRKATTKPNGYQIRQLKHVPDTATWTPSADAPTASQP
jgi:hypothetical protein